MKNLTIIACLDIQTAATNSLDLEASIRTVDPNCILREKRLGEKKDDRIANMIDVALAAFGDSPPFSVYMVDLKTADHSLKALGFLEIEREFRKKIDELANPERRYRKPMKAMAELERLRAIYKRVFEYSLRLQNDAETGKAIAWTEARGREIIAAIIGSIPERQRDLELFLEAGRALSERRIALAEACESMLLSKKPEKPLILCGIPEKAGLIGHFRGLEPAWPYRLVEFWE